MKSLKYFSLVLLLVAFYACSGKVKNEADTNAETEMVEVDVEKANLENLVKEIKKREADLEKGDNPNNAKKYRMIEAYIAYSERFNNRENADEYLFRAARMASEVGMTAESIKYFDRLYNEFDRYEDRPLALFMKAFVLENHANNLDEARIHYEKFLQEYPTHEMADDARISIQNLGKSAEDIIREFEIKDSIQKAQKAA